MAIEDVMGPLEVKLDIASRLGEADAYLSKLPDAATVHGWRYRGGWLAAVVSGHTYGSGKEPRMYFAEALIDAVDILKSRLGPIVLVLVVLVLVGCAVEPEPETSSVAASPAAPPKVRVEVRVQGFDAGAQVSACGLYMMFGEQYGRPPAACVEDDPRGDALFVVDLEPGVRRIWFLDDATGAARGEPWYVVEPRILSANRFSFSVGGL